MLHLILKLSSLLSVNSIEVVARSFYNQNNFISIFNLPGDVFNGEVPKNEMGRVL